MAKNSFSSFLSRLFGTQADQDQVIDGQKTENAQAQSAEPPVDETVLPLPADHAILKLWALYKRQAQEQLPPPMLRMASPKLSVLSLEEVKEELKHLPSAISASAGQRLTKAAPPEKQGEEASEPPVLDAQVTVIITKGQMSAWVMVYPPAGGGDELSREMLSAALSGSKVTFGLDDALLDSLPQNPERYFHLFLVAQGKPATDGKDGRIVDLFSREPEQKLDKDEFGQIDYTNLNLIQNVAEGDVICRIIPPTKGEAGRTVMDKEVPAKDGHPATPPAGRNTKVTEDGSAVVAAKAGDVKFNGRTFTVRQVMEIDGDVDYSVGSINYVGDVHIHGDVLSGFSIQAIGDITVDGVVEACSIEAGGDLVVAKGIAGNEQAIIRVHGNIYTKYLESCCVYARSSLETDCIMNCDVYCDGKVQVRSGRGAIIGGSVRAAQEVNVGIIGSQAELPTHIFLGGLPCEEFERESLLKEISNIEEEMKKTEQQPDSSVKLSQLSKMRMNILINKKKLEQAEKSLALLRENLEEQQNEGRLICDIAYRGTEINIGPAVLRLDHETRPCHAKLKEGEIAFF